ncbi:MAG TPA: excinuclease ABC subunit UvrB [Candidatus Cloacimonadota bacterium]|nr:excinuclease ABC subunit UvrB [Candidatus Cloacimonadota bacterium]HQB41310.1 excinuclease ABC subunit UvrB [Candidatus Cloacimonadota bacterium]
MKKTFNLISKYQPTGDQPSAIDDLAANVIAGKKHQVLLGVTGSGKTFTMANVIAKVNKPTLILSHNKTLAAQLYGEFKQLFPDNAVEYFISYYDYYQPEAYIPGKDIYIEKDSDINEQIERLRLKATMSLFERDDVIVVASVSCIYGLGVPEEYREAVISLHVGQIIERDDLLMRLVNSHYGRNDIAFERGSFRVRGDVVDIYPAYLENSIRIQFFGDEIEKITRLNPISGHILEEVKQYPIYPADHFVMSKERMERAVTSIENELAEQILYFNANNRFLESQRIEQRTKYDLEMIKEIGFCSGIENYSRHLTGAKKGSPPFCLLDYFSKDFLLFIDESHASIPQVRAMYAGDYSRKKNLVEYGFRLPSAFDNRPLKFEEFEQSINQVIYVSATPSDYELYQTKGEFVEQVIRPTGLLDPRIIVKPLSNQVDDLIGEINKRVEKKQRVLVTTLTKRMAEDLSKYLSDIGIMVRYLHSEIDTIQRSKIIRELRLGEFDVLVGINLLREGLDLPEVSLVAVLDADKTGFLRSTRSLIQTAGRAARHIEGTVIFYADEITDAMKYTIDETNRRREKQLAYNEKNHITPTQISKSVEDIMQSTSVAEGYQDYEVNKKPSQKEVLDPYLHLDSIEDIIKVLKKDMKTAAQNLNFELAAELRDRIIDLEEQYSTANQ